MADNTDKKATEDFEELCKKIIIDCLEKEFHCKDCESINNEPYDPVALLLDNYLTKRNALEMSDQDFCTKEEYKAATKLIFSLSLTTSRDRYIKKIMASEELSRLIIKCLNYVIIFWKAIWRASPDRLNKRKYKILECTYLNLVDRMSIDEIARKYHLHPRTVETDLETAVGAIYITILGGYLS